MLKEKDVWTWMINIFNFSDIEKLKRESGIALQDIISEVYYYIQTIDFPADMRIFLLDNLADIE